MWWLLSAAAVVALLLPVERPNAVWGTATFGLFIGIGIAIFRSGFDWSIVGKAGVIGALIGLVFELLPRIAKQITK